MEWAPRPRRSTSRIVHFKWIYIGCVPIAEPSGAVVDLQLVAGALNLCVIACVSHLLFEMSQQFVADDQIHIVIHST